MALCLKILYCFGALLSFADPFTDGLTCWKYYEAGKIVWFALCIVFMVVPSIIYFIFWLFILPTDEASSGKVVSKLRCCCAAMCCPFIPCCGRLYVALSTRKHEDHKLYIEVFNCLEVGIELAPQFILQFFAAMVQEDEVSTIQIVSLTVTFLRIGWAYAHISEDCKCRMCMAGLLSVAARIFAFALFAVALGPWVVLVIVLHMGLTCVIQRSHKVRAFGYIALSWLSYTPLGSDKDKETDAERVKWTSRTFVQPLVHVAEDIIMAVMYYAFVSSKNRTYEHRLKIMFGLIGASLLGYIVLRLSKFGKCQKADENEDAEGSAENLNNEDVVVVVVDGRKEADEPITSDVRSDNKLFSKAWVKSKMPTRARDKRSDAGRPQAEVGQTATDGGKETPAGTQEGAGQPEDPPRFGKAWVKSRLKMK